jgi:hypothetical protein
MKTIFIGKILLNICILLEAKLAIRPITVRSPVRTTIPTQVPIEKYLA